MNSTESIYPTASLWRRLFALVYDIFPLFGISCGVVALSIGIVALFGLYEFDQNFQNIIPSLLLTPLLIASWLAFYIGFWRYKQQTVGMLAWRIKLRGCNGSSPNNSQLLTRAIVALLSFGCFGLGYLWMLIDPKNRTWHDIASNTEVILTPKK